MPDDYDLKIDIDTSSAVTAQSRMQALAASTRVTAEDVALLNQEFGRTAPHVNTARDAVAGFTTAMIGMRAGGMVLSELREAFGVIIEQQQQLRDYARETAQENLKLRDVLREMKFLRGEAGGMGTESEEVLTTAFQTGMRKTEAVKFLKAMQDAQSAMAEKDKLTPEVSGVLTQEAGALVARADLPPEDLARTVGIFGRMGAGKDPEVAKNVLGMTVQALGVKSMADFKRLAPQFFGLANQLAGEGGRIEHIEDLAAFYAASTTTAGGRIPAAQAAQSILQSNLMVRQGLSKPESESGKYLAGLGIDETTEPQEAMRLMAPDALRADADIFFASKGFKNTSWVQATIRLARASEAAQEGIEANRRNRDPNDPMFGQAGRTLTEGNIKGLAEDQAILARVAEVGADIARQETGKPNEMLEITRMTAQNRLFRAGVLMKPFKEGEAPELRRDPGIGALPGMLADTFGKNLLGTPGQAAEAVDRDIFERTIAAGRKVGADVEQGHAPGSAMLRAMGADPTQRGQMLNELLVMVGKAPGGMEALQEQGVVKDRESVEYLRRITHALEKNASNPFGLPTAAPAAAPPAAKPARAGGGP